MFQGLFELERECQSREDFFAISFAYPEAERRLATYAADVPAIKWLAGWLEELELGCFSAAPTINFIFQNRQKPIRINGKRWQQNMLAHLATSVVISEKASEK